MTSRLGTAGKTITFFTVYSIKTVKLFQDAEEREAKIKEETVTRDKIIFHDRYTYAIVHGTVDAVICIMLTGISYKTCVVLI